MQVYQLGSIRHKHINILLAIFSMFRKFKLVLHLFRYLSKYSVVFSPSLRNFFKNYFTFVSHLKPNPISQTKKAKTRSKKFVDMIHIHSCQFVIYSKEVFLKYLNIPFTSEKCFYYNRQVLIDCQCAQVSRNIS